MKNSFEWENRPNVESNIEGSIGKDIIVLPKLNLAISQLIERRGDLNIAPITENIGIGGEAHLNHYQPAIDVIESAIKANKHICVFMDFDCDGQTAGCCMFKTLSRFYKNISWVVGSRLTDGHGLIPRLITAPAGSLIITVDTGISSIDAVTELQNKGYEVLVTDHHLIEEKKPSCTYLDPKDFLKEGDDEYMAPGVYVSAKLALLVAKHHLNETEWFEAWHYCACLVSMGIVSDVIELNTLMRQQLNLGLCELCSTTHSGIKALLGLSNYKENQPISATFLSYNVLPKINACGRLGRSDLGVKLLLLENDTSLSSTESLLAANELKSINASRKIIEQSVFEQAVAQADTYIATHPNSLVLFDKSWHVGVIGIIAARIAEIYGVSTLVMSEMNNQVVGSGRTVNGKDLFGDVSECKDLLLGFGGHKAACGCQLELSNLEAFKTKFESVCAKHNENSSFKYLIDADVNIENLYDVEFQMFCLNIEPYGNMNPDLILRLKNVLVESIENNVNSSYFLIDDDLDNKIRLSKFRCPEEWKTFTGSLVDVLISPFFTYFSGSTVVEWRIIDIKESK